MIRLFDKDKKQGDESGDKKEKEEEDTNYETIAVKKVRPLITHYQYDNYFLMFLCSQALPLPLPTATTKSTLPRSRGCTATAKW